MEFVRKGALVPMLVLLAGCGGNQAMPSTSFPTNTIYAYMKAVQDESGNVATTVQLRDGPTAAAGYLYLAGGEALYGSLDKPPQQYLNFTGDLFANSLELSQQLKVLGPRDLYTDYGLFNEVIWGKPEYFANAAPATAATPLRVHVDFERSGQVLTGTSTIELPPAFQITAPAYDAVLSRATPITLTWDNVDAVSTMELDVAGSCLDGSRYTLHLVLGADTGTATLNGADYFPASGVSPTANCRIAFLLQRGRLGGVSAQFAFGSFKGMQQRTVQFTSTP